MFSKYEIFAIIDAAIKEESRKKNEYITKHGYKNKMELERFAIRINAYSELYGKFDANGTF